MGPDPSHHRVQRVELASSVTLKDFLPLRVSCPHATSILQLYSPGRILRFPNIALVSPDPWTITLANDGTAGCKSTRGTAAFPPTSISSSRRPTNSPDPALLTVAVARMPWAAFRHTPSHLRNCLSIGLFLISQVNPTPALSRSLTSFISRDGLPHHIWNAVGRASPKAMTDSTKPVHCIQS